MSAAPPLISGATIVVEAQGVTAGFGAQTVLHGVDLAVASHSVTGIFGLNGAGKSVFLKVLAGVVPARRGNILVLGQDVTRSAPETRVGLGVGHVPQGRQVFPSLSVEQNLRVGAYTLRRRDRGRYAANLARVYDTFPRLAERRMQPAGTLSGGEQAMLAVGRALINDPSVILIDEPSAGLAPTVVESLLEVLLTLRGTGPAMVLVEQNIRFGLRLADRVCLMQKGRIVHDGPTAELDEDQLASSLGVGRLLRPEVSRPAARRTRSATRGGGRHSPSA
jgi:branched-chain amino acid transport system ATP-binding protein